MDSDISDEYSESEIEIPESRAGMIDIAEDPLPGNASDEEDEYLPNVFDADGAPASVDTARLAGGGLTRADLVRIVHVYGAGKKKDEPRNKRGNAGFAAYLPYDVESDSEALALLETIISNLCASLEAASVDGIQRWLEDIQRWRQLGYEFPKRIRVHLIHLLVEACVHPGLPAAVVKTISKMLSWLVFRLCIIDLQLDWRVLVEPIFEKVEYSLAGIFQDGSERAAGQYLTILRTVQPFFPPHDAPAMLQFVLSRMSEDGAMMTVCLGVLTRILPLTHVNLYWPFVMAMYRDMPTESIRSHWEFFFARLVKAQMDPAVNDSDLLDIIRRLASVNKYNEPHSVSFIEIGDLDQDGSGALDQDNTVAPGPSHSAPPPPSAAAAPTIGLFSLDEFRLIIDAAQKTISFSFVSNLGKDQATQTLSRRSIADRWTSDKYIEDFIDSMPSLGDESHIAQIIAYSIFPGPGGDAALDEFARLVAYVEPYVNPASDNAEGAGRALRLLGFFASRIRTRLVEEARPQCKTPAHRRLTPAHVSRIVGLLLPILKSNMYGRRPGHALEVTLRILAFVAEVAPCDIIDFLLDKAALTFANPERAQQAATAFHALRSILPYVFPGTKPPKVCIAPHVPLALRDMWRLRFLELVPFVMASVEHLDQGKSQHAMIFLQALFLRVPLQSLGASHVSPDTSVPGCISYVRCGASPDSDDEPSTDEPDTQLDHTQLDPTQLHDDPMQIDERVDMRATTQLVTQEAVQFFSQLLRVLASMPESSDDHQRGVEMDSFESTLISTTSHLIACLTLEPFTECLDILAHSLQDVRTNGHLQVERIVGACAHTHPETTVARILPLCKRRILQELGDGAAAEPTTKDEPSLGAISAMSLRWWMHVLRGLVASAAPTVLALFPRDIEEIFSELHTHANTAFAYEQFANILDALGIAVFGLLAPIPVIHPLSPIHASEAQTRASWDLYGQQYTLAEAQIPWRVATPEIVDRALGILEFHAERACAAIDSHVPRDDSFLDGADAEEVTPLDVPREAFLCKETSIAFSTCTALRPFGPILPSSNPDMTQGAIDSAYLAAGGRPDAKTMSTQQQPSFLASHLDSVAQDTSRIVSRVSSDIPLDLFPFRRLRYYTAFTTSPELMPRVAHTRARAKYFSYRLSRYLAPSKGALAPVLTSVVMSSVSSAMSERQAYDIYASRSIGILKSTSVNMGNAAASGGSVSRTMRTCRVAWLNLLLFVHMKRSAWALQWHTPTLLDRLLTHYTQEFITTPYDTVAQETIVSLASIDMQIPTLGTRATWSRRILRHLAVSSPSDDYTKVIKQRLLLTLRAFLLKPSNDYVFRYHAILCIMMRLFDQGGVDKDARLALYSAVAAMGSISDMRWDYTPPRIIDASRRMCAFLRTDCSPRANHYKNIQHMYKEEMNEVCASLTALVTDTLFGLDDILPISARSLLANVFPFLDTSPQERHSHWRIDIVMLLFLQMLVRYDRPIDDKLPAMVAAKMIDPMVASDARLTCLHTLSVIHDRAACNGNALALFLGHPSSPRIVTESHDDGLGTQDQTPLVDMSPAQLQNARLYDLGTPGWMLRSSCTKFRRPPPLHGTTALGHLWGTPLEFASQQALQNLARIVDSPDWWEHVKDVLVKATESRADDPVTTRTFAFLIMLFPASNAFQNLQKLVDSLVRTPPESPEKEISDVRASDLVHAIIHGVQDWPVSNQKPVWHWLAQLCDAIWVHANSETPLVWHDLFFFASRMLDSRCVPVLRTFVDRSLDPNTAGIPQFTFNVSITPSLFSFGAKTPCSVTDAFMHRAMGIISDRNEDAKASLSTALVAAAETAMYFDYKSLDGLLTHCSETQTLDSSAVAQRFHILDKWLNTVLDELDRLYDEIDWSASFTVSQKYDHASLTFARWVQCTSDDDIQRINVFERLVEQLIRMHKRIDVKDLRTSTVTTWRELMAKPHSVPRIAYLLQRFHRLLRESPGNWQLRRDAVLALIVLYHFSFLKLPYEILVNFVSIAKDALHDSHVEVRRAGQDLLAPLVRALPRDQIKSLAVEFLTESTRRVPNRHLRDGTSAPSYRNELVKLHAAVLGASAIVFAFPYSIPPLVTSLLISVLTRHTAAPPPVCTSAEAALASFKETHRDSWDDTKSALSEDQQYEIQQIITGYSYYA